MKQPDATPSEATLREHAELLAGGGLLAKSEIEWRSKVLAKAYLELKAEMDKTVGVLADGVRLGVKQFAEGAQRSETQPTASYVDAHLDNVLRASGSALKNYTMEKTLGAMRSAMRNAINGGAQVSAPAGVQAATGVSDDAGSTGGRSSSASSAIEPPPGYRTGTRRLMFNKDTKKIDVVTTGGFVVDSFDPPQEAM